MIFRMNLILDVYFLGKHAEYLYIQANYDNFSSAINLLDAKLYISNQKIDENLNANGRFVSDYVLVLDEIIEFRFNSIPAQMQIGFGNASTNDIVFHKNGSTGNLYRNVNANRSGVQGYCYFAPFFSETSYTFLAKKYVYQSGHVGMGVYCNGSHVDYWECGQTGKRLVVQKYANDPFDVEIVIV